MIIGEFPDKYAEEQGVPFTGAVNNLLAEALLEAGINIHDTWRTNVLKFRPPDGDLKRLRNVETFYPALYEEIRMVDPNCILALGDLALTALTNNYGVQKWRGSILRSPFTNTKTIPTIHPSALFAHGDTKLPWINQTFIKADIARAVKQSKFPEIKLPTRNLLIAKSSLDVIRYLERWIFEDRCVVDVETSKTIPLCIGLAHSKHEAISIPTFSENISDHELAYIWRILSEYFGDTKVKLVAQNMKFDQKRCRQLGIKWANPWMDIATAWHILWSEMPKKLQFISSFLTEEPYYKDEGKEYDPKKDKIDRLFLYNARDCVVEFECMEIILADLKEAGLYDFYFDHIMPLHMLYYDMEDTGLLQDQLIKNQLIKNYSELRVAKKQRMLAAIAAYGEMTVFRLKGKSKGEDIIKSIPLDKFNCDSPQQVAAMLYGYLNCPVRQDTGEATLKALANNGVKDTVRQDIIKGILEDRKIGKTIGTYLEAEVSTYPISSFSPFTDTSRIHTQVNINGTTSGRTSTSVCKVPVTTKQHGIALQTMTKHGDDTLDVGGADLRSMFIADPGWSFIEADLAGAEDRPVALLCDDWDAIKQLDKKDFIYNAQGLKDDRHTLTACFVCDKDFTNITDYDRQIGKRTRHAGNYDMGKHQGMITFAKYGLFLSEWKVGKLLENFHAANPRIRNVFHAGIQDALASNNKTLISPFGRREVFFDQWGNDLFKKAYSFIPQATVTDCVKFAMVRIVARTHKSWFRFAAESHDSCLPLVRDDKVALACKIIKEEMERPIDFRKCTISRDYQLVIPCDVKVGKRWVDRTDQFPDGMTKFKF